MLDIRKASLDDMRVVFENANEPEVRSMSINSEPIKWEEHVRWFEWTICDEAVLYYTAYQAGIFIGQVRVNCDGESAATVSISLSKNGRGRGFGSKILGYAEKG